jgi:hypothetical protein
LVIVPVPDITPVKMNLMSPALLLSLLLVMVWMPVHSMSEAMVKSPDLLFVPLPVMRLAPRLNWMGRLTAKVPEFCDKDQHGVVVDHDLAGPPEGERQGTTGIELEGSVVDVDVARASDADGTHGELAGAEFVEIPIQRDRTGNRAAGHLIEGNPAVRRVGLPAWPPTCQI